MQSRPLQASSLEIMTIQDTLQSDAEAHIKSGLKYEYGQGVPQDDQEAVRYYRLAADQGNALAQYHLGYMYLAGRGVSQEDQEAARFFRLSADQGNACAQYELGCLYLKGYGVPQDGKEAMRFFLLAIAQGYTKAQCHVGFMYLEGRGVPQNDKKAVHFFRLAADLGHAASQYELGCMYLKGHCVTQDDKEAVRFFRLAVDQGHTNAQNQLDWMYAHLKSEDVLYYAAIVLKRPKMLKELNRLAKKNPEKLSLLLEENPKDWEKIQTLLDPKIALEFYKYMQALAVKKQSLLEKTTPLYSNLSRIVLNYSIADAENIISSQAILENQPIFDREEKSTFNKIHLFFNHTQNIPKKNIITGLGLDEFNSSHTKANLKQIQSDFLNEQASFGRRTQGEQLKFLYIQMKNIQHQMKSTQKISTKSLGSLAKYLTKVELSLSSNKSHLSQDEIIFWSNKLGKVKTCLNQVIDHVKREELQSEITNLSIRK